MNKSAPFVILGLIAIVFLAISQQEGVSWVVDTSRYPARWMCGRWSPSIGWLHIASDVITWLSYLAIPAVLLFFAQKRGQLPFKELFWLFSAFIIFCGSTHLMEAVIFWWPAYGLAGLLKFGTAIVSVATAVALTQAIPQAFAFRSPHQLEQEVQRRTRELEDARKYAMLFFESSPVSMLTIDGQGTIVLANKAAIELFGYLEEELLGNSVELLVPQRYRSKHPGLRDGYFADPSDRPMGAGRDLFGVHKSGAEIPVEIGLTPIENIDGRAVLCTVIDLSERKRSEVELKNSEAILRGIVDNSTNFIGLMATDGTVLDVNRTALVAASVGPEEVLQKPFWETPWWSHSEEQQEQLKQSIQSAAAGETVGFEATHHTPDGEVIFVDFSIHPILDETGKAIFLIPEGRDTTEHKRRLSELAQLNTKLARSNEGLEQSNIELQQFAYVASHDLQTPLRTIGGFTQLLHKEYEGKIESATADRYVEKVVAAVQRMESLIRDLLSYSSVESSSQQFKAVDLVETFDDTISLLEVDIENTGASVTRDPLPTVSGDPSQLSHLMQNLIGNGLKYCGEQNPVIRVTASRNDDEWLISVSDNGIGIATEHHEKVFEIFKRLHTQQAYPGTGIGLAVCRRIVLRHGGRIWIESEEGEGTSIRFTLQQVEAIKLE